ncbi:hypothetical protein AB3X52_18155 [Nocardioides sp. DS6]|uniref:Polysaccharide chain length determinant N-terminal domain-containing protein n=1 Tax=Nocardioides eburneus TaxID=3231482 RepID=A0ABV3T2W3_9ACTN
MSWRLDDAAAVDETQSTPVFASLVYLRNALRRRRRTWLGLAAAGLALGGAYAVAVPADPVADTTLILSHPEGQDPSSAMQTDLSILRTREVADRAAAKLDMTPTALSQAISATIITPTILRIRITGPDETTAITRAQVVGQAFLSYRGAMLRAESEALVAGYEQRIQKLKSEMTTLTHQYASLSSGKSPQQQRVAETVLTQRSQDQAQVDTLQQQIEDTTTSIDAVVTASSVVDPADIVPVSAPKRVILSAISGLVVGGALGLGIVLVQALTTTRLRRREEIALALDAPVTYAAERPSALRPALRRRGVDTLARGVVAGLGRPGPRRPLALLTLAGDRRAARTVDAVAVTAVRALVEAGQRVLVVDLTPRGRLGHLLTGVAARVHRPDWALAWGPLDPEQPDRLRPAGQPGQPGGPTAPEGWDEALSSGTVLVVGRLELGAGVDELATWTDRAVVLLTAGSTSAERLRSAADLLSAAGIELAATLLADADRSDESAGRRAAEGATPASAADDGETVGRHSDVVAGAVPDPAALPAPHCADPLVPAPVEQP